MDDLEDLARRQGVSQNQLDPTRSRPEPWFVGSGKGLMIAVLAAVAILVAFRAVSTVWMIENAWARWKNRFVVTDSNAMPTVRRAPNEVRLAPGVRAASAATDEAEWITSDDYPVNSIRREEQGAVRIRWIIGTDGRATSCGIVESSGHPRLDAAACDAITRNARYKPARAADGTVMMSTQTRRVKWVLPTQP